MDSNNTVSQNTIDFLTTKFNLQIGKKYPTKIGNINRTIMAQTLGELGFTIGTEVGVAQGFHAEILCRENPNLKTLNLVDIWSPYDGYNEYTNRIDSYYIQARKRLESYTQCIFMKEFSKDAAQKIENGSLDFVYIDAAHDFENVAIDLCEWSKKVRVGGIVFGHDYKRHNGNDKYIVNVKDVVQAFVYAHNIHPLFELLNDIRDPKFGVDCMGWMFVRRETDWIK